MNIDGDLLQIFPRVLDARFGPVGLNDRTEPLVQGWWDVVLLAVAVSGVGRGRALVSVTVALGVLVGRLDGRGWAFGMA